MKRLTGVERDAAVSATPQWQLSEDAGGQLMREFKFASFAAAFAFMTEAALVAERHDHHPDWRNVYDRVWVTLTTHDASGLTSKDVSLAQAMDAIYARFATHAAAAG
jgi:4a-hydroxytetrahydrobiopterin dehydratase